MARHVQADLEFIVPDDWQDRCITAYSGPLEPGFGVAPNIVVTRDALDRGETLAAYSDRQLVSMAQNLEGFELLGRREVLLGGLRGAEVHYRWDSEHGLLEQRQVFVAPRGSAVFSFVATAQQDDLPRVQEQFDALYASVRFRGATSPGPSGTGRG